MSAYALPGLFPPIDFMSQSSSNDTNGTIKDLNMPLHLQDHDQKYNSKYDQRNYENNLEDDEVKSSSSSNIGCIFNSAAIAVKEAKIDPVRWIQYVTGANPQQYAHQIGKTLRRRVSTSNNSITTGTRSSGQSNRTFCDSSSGLHAESGFIAGDSPSSKNNKSQQNEAIEFELSITFDGRKYTAKRTMQCIMQLRDDLIREMKHTINGHLRFTQPSYFGVTHSSCDKVSTIPGEDSIHSYAVQIPEIPPFTNGNDRRQMLGDTGFVGKGFTMLHAMVKSYVPAMESWLKNVMEIVPQDSECLMNFLWEPSGEVPSSCFKSVLDSVNNNDERTTCFSNKFKSSTSLATLGSIKEMDYVSGDDDSEYGPDDYSARGWKE